MFFRSGLLRNELLFHVLGVMLEGLGKQKVLFYDEKSEVHMVSASIGKTFVLRAHFNEFCSHAVKIDVLEGSEGCKW